MVSVFVKALSGFMQKKEKRKEEETQLILLVALLSLYV